MPHALSVLDGVRWHGTTVVGHRPRALLEALVYAGRSGSATESLIASIWGDDPPAHPTKALQILVSRVRTATGPHVVERTERGYRLGLDRHDVDALAQADLRAAARTAYNEGRYSAALDAARDALVLGACDETRGILALSSSHAGEHAVALPMLEERAHEHPNDDDTIACLLRSESAVRGPGAALERYERYRTGLVDRLGSDPGPAVTQAYRDILAADRPVRTGVRYDGTTLLGRDTDIRQLNRLLHESRVVSIVGAGGLGKTRLAHVLGREAEQPVVCFVELVGITTSDDVVGEVASVLGIRDSVADRRLLTAEQRADVRSRIAQHLDGAPTLLILDNCEHVVDAAADLIAYLVATTRDLRVVTTSRAPLNIGAEHVYALEHLDDTDAYELFRQRATAARPNVVLDDAGVSAVVGRLDGLPLAIELAAAKVRVMSVGDIAQRLENRFALLRGGDRAAPDRHQTLLAVIDWSWNLLAEQQRRALMRLSVFHDGFTLSAAEYVLGPDALDAVDALVQQSLLSVDEVATSVRYRMLETVREFGRMQLVDAGDETAALEAQTSWARAYADIQLSDVMGPAQERAIDALRTEEANLTDLLRRALAEPDPDSVVVLLAALGAYWSITGEHTRIIRILGALEDAIDGWTPPAELVDHARAAASIALTNAVIAHPELPARTHALLERLGTGSPNPRLAATCEAVLALGEPDPVRRRARIDQLCDGTDRFTSLQALQYRSHLRENEGYAAEAIDDAERALALCEHGDDPWTPAILHTQLAQLNGQLGRHHESAAHSRSALGVLDRLGAVDDASQGRTMIAVHAMHEGRFDDAEVLLDEIDQSGHQRLGYGGNGMIALSRAELALARGQIDTGLEVYRSAIERVRAIRFPGGPEPDGLEPWTLFGEAAGLTAYALQRCGDDGEDLWDLLCAKIQRVVDPGRADLDYPVVGLVLFGLGSWSLRRDVLPVEDTVHLLVLAERFAYPRYIPTMAWERATEPAERVAPGAIEDLNREYGDRRGKDLIGDVRTFLDRIFG